MEAAEVEVETTRTALNTELSDEERLQVASDHLIVVVAGSDGRLVYREGRG